jgi:NADH-quinone oxidoreductase subunit E
MEELVEKILPRYNPNKKDGLIPILQDVQKEQGYLTEEAVEKIGKYLNLPVNKIYGVAAFYDQFRFRRAGQFHVQICHGTTCHLFGASTYLKEVEKQLRIKAGSTSRDRRFSLEIVNCLGACNQAPVLKINDTCYPMVTPEELTRIIRSIKDKTE